VGAYDALLLSLKGNSPLHELPVRQAVASAIDRPAIVDNVWKDAAEVTPSLVPPALLGAGASSVRGWDYDPARARSLLDGSGWVQAGNGVRTKDGRPLDLTLRVYDPDANNRVPELLQRQLAEVGIGVRIDTDPTAYGESLEKGDGDLFLEIGNQYDANPAFPGALFTAEPVGFADYATSFGAGPEYDQAFDRAIASTDSNQARIEAANAMHLAVDEVVAVVPIAGIKRVWGLRSNVRGFVPHPSDISQQWDEVFVER
jgi:peptide/nickel transport system substrate-binding protein